MRRLCIYTSCLTMLCSTLLGCAATIRPGCGVLACANTAGPAWHNGAAAQEDAQERFNVDQQACVALAVRLVPFQTSDASASTDRDLLVYGVTSSGEPVVGMAMDMSPPQPSGGIYANTLKLQEQQQSNQARALIALRCMANRGWNLK